ncbi:FAD-dependent oxidoreductase [Vibrio salinus]|uniref:FAD-dependent oxidoreductase n=1 Tax=Vibrio salinus TaxID=2899784 RepID=UPI001E2E4E66|nr:FAD-dependent oxidoreductase [Vibrio salinus]MCE0492472.1 FAD-dependent oxidoreductase [Vibrio salinus]
MKKIIVIGGSAAGPKTAAKARRLDEHAEIILLQKEKDLSMASCGYPYYVGGVFDNRNELISTPTGVVRDPKFFLNAKGIDARTETEVVSIDRNNHTVTCKHIQTGQIDTLGYDKLVICTGAKPVIPPVPGTDLNGITTLQSLKDADFLRKIRDEKKVKKAVVVGGGLIGIETCEALQLAGIDITIVELAPQLLTFLDSDMAKLVENHVRSKGANVLTSNGLSAFLGEDGQLTGVKLANGTELECELAVVSIGVRPNVDLAKEAGLEIGQTGGIVVDKHMQTSDPDIYAAGDCVESFNLITEQKVHAPMGDLANLQGRVAGENVIAGNVVTFDGVYQTGICKVFDFSAGSTGLSETVAKTLGYDTYETVINASPDKPGFMGANLLISKMLADKKTGRVLGLQCIGPGDVSKQIATAAMALKGKFTVEDLINLDMPYAPPFSLAIDHFIATGHLMQNKLKERLVGISPEKLYKKLSDNEKPFILDVRGPDEFEEMRLGIGETLIPLGVLRQRLDELPEDKNAEIICFCKISLRGYEASLILKAYGWTNVKVMEGGVVSWPYPRER